MGFKHSNPTVRIPNKTGMKQEILWVLLLCKDLIVTLSHLSNVYSLHKYIRLSLRKLFLNWSKFWKLGVIFIPSWQVIEWNRRQ